MLPKKLLFEVDSKKITKRPENFHQNCSKVVTKDSPGGDKTQTNQQKSTEAEAVSVASSASVEQVTHMSSNRDRVTSVEMTEKHSRLCNTGTSYEMKVKPGGDFSKLNLEAKKNFFLGKFKVGVQRNENQVGHCAQVNKNVSDLKKGPETGNWS